MAQKLNINNCEERFLINFRLEVNSRIKDVILLGPAPFTLSIIVLYVFDEKVLLKIRSVF